MKKPKKLRGVTKNNPSDISTGAYMYKHSENSTYKITLGMLKKFWDESKSVGKSPILIISIPNDKDGDFILTCTIQIEYKNGTNSNDKGVTNVK